MGLAFLTLFYFVFFSYNAASHDPDIRDMGKPRDYNLIAHTVGTAVVFISSMAPIICVLIFAKKKNKYCFDLFKFFGIGVVISTCWCHLISEAFENAQLLKEKLVLPVGFIPMVSVFLLHAIDVFAHSRIQDYPMIDEGQEVNPNTLIEAPRTQNTDAATYEPICKKRKEELKLTFLETGILIHSVIIGLSLGITQTNFCSLLVCICFHQLFEGLAIVTYVRDSVTSYKYQTLLYIIYAIATPIGMITGILFQLFYNYSGIGYELVEKVLNLISSGLLIYTSYVELMANDMQPQSEAFRKLSLKKKGLLMFSTYLGAMAMTITGIWM